MIRSARRQSASSSRSQASKSSNSPRVVSPARREREIAEIERQYPEVVGTTDPGSVKGAVSEKGIRDPGKMSLVERLRMLKTKAIEEWQFDKSDAIQRYMELKCVDDTGSVIERAEASVRDLIDTAIQNYEACVLVINEEALEKRVKVRTNCDNLYEEMQQRHIRELTDLEIEREVAVMREQNRMPSKYFELMKQSQRAAKSNDSVGARGLKTQAERLKKSQQDTRIAAVNTKYEKLTAKAMEKQKSEIEGLQVNLARLLQEADQELDQSLRDRRRKSAVYIRHSLGTVMTQICESLEKPESKAKVTTALEKFVQQLLKEQEKEFLLNTSE